eukprot:82540-Rhodomonas_salina.1
MRTFTTRRWTCSEAARSQRCPASTPGCALPGISLSVTLSLLFATPLPPVVFCTSAKSEMRARAAQVTWEVTQALIRLLPGHAVVQ